MRNILLGTFIAVSSASLFLLTTDGTSRVEAETAITTSLREGSNHSGDKRLFWVACNWATGVYGPVRVCN